MVLGMLQQALSALGEVTVATDAADALLKAVDDLPDVMICDYRMPGHGREAVAGETEKQAATAGIAVILMASKADISETIVDAGPDRRLSGKAFLLKDATHKIKRVVTGSRWRN